MNLKLKKFKTIQFYCFSANGSIDPRHRQGSGKKCAYCGQNFSYWDDLQLCPTDIDLKCAVCKDIRIQLIRK